MVKGSVSFGRGTNARTLDTRFWSGCRNQSEGGVVSGFKPLLNIRASVYAVIDDYFVLLTLGDSDTGHIRCLVKNGEALS